MSTAKDTKRSTSTLLASDEWQRLELELRAELERDWPDLERAWKEAQEDCTVSWKEAYGD